MLKKKLAGKATNKVVNNDSDIQETNNNNNMPLKTSHLFATSLWQSVYNLECQLNENLQLFKPGPEITHIYNPVEYAGQLHCEYLRHYLKGTKKLLFIGMNPGHDGMGQTGLQKFSIQIKMFEENYTVPELWEEFYYLERVLNENLRSLIKSSEITHVYNPIEYAADIHCKYLRKYLNGQRNVLFIGMNPGPNGMAQTGVPFGNISTVKNIMGLHGSVDKPALIHPKRPIEGLESTREEPSGKRLWTLFQKLSNDSLDIFFEQCFVHNFCPLLFFNINGNNITPNELKGTYKQQIRDECLRTTEQILNLIQPQIIVAIGLYVYDTLKKSEYCKNKRLLRLAHPSPRSLNNNDWPMKAEKFLIDEDLLKYMRNEVHLK